MRYLISAAVVVVAALALLALAINVPDGASEPVPTPHAFEPGDGGETPYRPNYSADGLGIDAPFCGGNDALYVTRRDDRTAAWCVPRVAD